MRVGDDDWARPGPDGAVHLVERRTPTWWHLLTLVVAASALWRLVEQGWPSGWWDRAGVVLPLLLGIFVGRDLLRRWTDRGQLRLDPGGLRYVRGGRTVECSWALVDRFDLHGGAADGHTVTWEPLSVNGFVQFPERDRCLPGDYVGVPAERLVTWMNGQVGRHRRTPTDSTDQSVSGPADAG